MRSFLQSRLTLILIIGIVFSFLPNVTTPSAQATSGYAYKWTLHFDFESSFDGELRMEAGRNNGSGGVVQPPIYRERFVVPCGANGAVNLAGGVAQLNGGYLKCSLDLQAAIEAVEAGCNALDPHCTIPVDNVEKYMSVKLGADLNTPAMTTIPILAHDNLAFSVDVASATHAVLATVDPVGEIVSNPWPAIPPTNTFHSHTAAYACTALMDCGIHYTVAGTADYVDTADTLAEIAIAETSFFIGRDLTGAVIAAGSQLDNIFIDPGNGFPD
ncbi:MAG TPA: hypothetical protein P5121_24360 [Caldilineaceae bacterium]|nr:hypothetical protein [Caldilineaceae bacterium]